MLDILMSKFKGLYILNADSANLIYGESERRDIARLVDICGPDQSRQSVKDNPSVLSKAQVLLTGWGCPVLDDAFLRRMPDLKAVFYGGGATGPFITPAVWERRIQVTSAIEANSIPVAEFTLATIILSLKKAWQFSRQLRDDRRCPERTAPGLYGSTVGLISMGTIARALLKLLAPFEVNVIVYDPYLAADEAAALGVERVALNELFQRSDVVSVHTPWLAETEGLVCAEHFALMKPDATFINTARGAIVEESDMVEAAARRPDLQFILDVLRTEPPVVDSPLYTLPNIFLTPHIAGSLGTECRRMGRYMVQELERFVTGQPLRWAVTADDAKNTSHRPAHRQIPAKVTIAPSIRPAAKRRSVDPVA
jgi:phosphoglycerate dehydrogenase-like enzyme